MSIKEQGWECPKCLRIWAPKINACGACNNRMAIVPPTISEGRPVNPIVHIVSAERHPTWNYNGDDISFSHQDGDPA